MPIIEFHMLEGRTPEQKRNLVANVTATVCETLSVQPETVRIIIHELPPGHFAVAGVTTADRRAEAAAAEQPASLKVIGS